MSIWVPSIGLFVCGRFRQAEVARMDNSSAERADTKGDLAVAPVLLLEQMLSAGLSHSPDYEHPLVLPQLRHL